MNIIISGGPKREKFNIEGNLVSQTQLIRLLNSVSGISAGKSKSDALYVVTPNGRASKSALSKASSAMVVDASKFFNDILSPEQEQQFFNAFDKELKEFEFYPETGVDVDNFLTILRKLDYDIRDWIVHKTKDGIISSVSFAADASLEDLRNIAKNVVGGHYIVETLNNKKDFTGERYYQGQISK